MLRTPHRGGALMVRGIKFAGIPVRNQDVSLKFYTEALGLKVITDQPFTDKQRWIELLIPGAETGVALYTPEGHEKRIGEFQSIAFWCDDVFATAKVLKSKGVTFAQEPKNEPWGSIAIFKDPDGYPFVLVFATRLSEISRFASRLSKHAAPNALVWISYPKKTSKVPGNLSRDVIREAMSAAGWRSVSIVAIDEVWSALRFRPASQIGSRLKRGSDRS